MIYAPDDRSEARVSAVAGRFVGAWLGIVLTGIIGLVLVVAPHVVNGQIPGDLGDARFNSYVLEHGYRWLTGQTASFWNAASYYPFPLTIAFSDNHLGNDLVYSVLRLIGCDREDAYRGWYELGYVANFAACAYTLRKLEHGWLAAASGAFLFAFGLPITAQSSHAQLIYRFGVPLAMLSLIQFGQRPRLSSLVALGFWTVWQFYCSIYIGYFLCLLLGAFALGQALVGSTFGRGTLRHWPLRLAGAWRGASGGGRAGFLIAGGVFAALLVGLFMPYREVTRLYGFHRTWAEIATMLPRLASYLLADLSGLWKFPWSGFDALPMRHEHQMFFGVAPLLALAIALVLGKRNRAPLGPLFASALLAICFLCLLTLWVHGHSVYRFVATLPGVNSIRAVTRICVVLLFPISMLLARSLDAISGARIAKPVRYACQLLVVVLLVVESSDIDQQNSTKSEWQERLRAAAAQLPTNLPASPILILAPGRNEPAYLRELDGIILAQDRGWPTLNGYSGNTPPGHVLTGGCGDAAADISTALDFLGRTGDNEFERLAKRVVMVGYDGCDPSLFAHRLHRASFAGPLPAGLMGKTEVAIEGLRVENGTLFATVMIRNHGTSTIPAMSSTGTPVRLSARYFPADHLTPEELRAPGWDLRQDLAGDVPADGSLRIDVPMAPPQKGGPNVVAVSLVQDGVGWFHDRGMPIATSAQQITMSADGLHLVN
ncbi:hypothetical protein [Aliidongia dinghuensis]|nr:hypothetical protein [Aliidongia dinghuensis]